MSDMFPSELFDSTVLESTVRAGVTLTFDWAPNPIVLAEEFDAAAVRMQDIRVPLEASKRIAIADVEAHFETESDPEGHKWVALAPDYLAQKESDGFGDMGILRRDDILYSGATNDSAYMVDGHDLFFDGSSMPDYWMIHQWGGVAGKGATIPQRAYLGLDEEASLEVLAVFDAWIDESMPYQTMNPLIGGGFAVRGAGGKFIKA